MSTTITDEALGILRNSGLVLDSVEADGVLHSCGTTEKPRSKNGRYIIHADEFPLLWWTNYNSGESGSNKLYSADRLTAAQRKAEREAMERRRAARDAELQAERKAAAEEARRLIAGAGAATDANPYLKRKDVHAVPGLHETDLGEDVALLVPVLDGAGEVQSCQFVLADGGKRFLSGGRTKGCYFPVPARDGGTSGPLLIAEGVATALSLHEATGFAVLAAFNCGNMAAVAETARKR